MHFLYSLLCLMLPLPLTPHTYSLATFHLWNKWKRSLHEHTSLPDVVLPPQLAYGQALATVTQVLLLLKFPDDAVFPHTSGPSARNILILVYPEKPYAPTNPSRLATNSVHLKPFLTLLSRLITQCITIVCVQGHSYGSFGLIRQRWLAEL